MFLFENRKIDEKINIYFYDHILYFLNTTYSAKKKIDFRQIIEIFICENKKCFFRQVEQ